MPQTLTGGVAVAAVLMLSPLVGVALGRLARSLAGRDISTPVMAAGALAVALSALWLSSAPLPAGLILGWALLVLAAVDVATYRLPDVVTLPLCGAGLLWTAQVHDSVIDAAAGALVGFCAIAAIDLIYRRIRGRSGIGLGDAKLFAVAGAWLGLWRLPAVLLLTCAGGLAWVAVRLLRQGWDSRSAPLPLGAPMAAAIWILWLWLNR